MGAAHPSGERRALISLGLPIVATQLAQAGMGLTDTLMAGRYGADDLAGVAIGTSLWHPLMLLFIGILMAAVPLAAHAFGGRDFATIRRILQQGVWMALMLALSGALLLQLAPVIYRLLEVEAGMGRVAEGYLDAMLWGLPAATLHALLRSGFEALHQTRLVMLVSLAGVAVNVPLNYLLIFGVFGFPELGGVGCGWATAIALWFQLGLAVWLSHRHPAMRPVRLWQCWQRPEGKMLGHYVTVGLPIGAAIFVEASMFLLIALLLTPLGSTVVSGHQIAFSTVSFTFMVPLSLAMALTIRIGYHLGAGAPEAALGTARTGMKLAALIALASGLTLALGAPSIAGLYTDEAEVAALATLLLRLGALFQLSDVMQVCLGGALRGYRDTRFPLYGALLAYWLIGLPLGHALATGALTGTPLGAAGYWSGFIAGLTSAALLLGWRLYHTARRALDAAVA